MQCWTAIEEEYRTAKARLLTEPQESIEAAVEFISARTALREMLEDLWPSSDNLCECSSENGYHKTAYGQHQTR